MQKSKAGKLKNASFLAACFVICLYVAAFIHIKEARAASCTACICEYASQNDGATRALITAEHLQTVQHFNDEFADWEQFLINPFFHDHLLPALMGMTNQIVATAMQQMLAVGMFFDAEHQLEVQDLFRQKMAEAYNDYQPSQDMCVFGTNVRSLADANARYMISADIISQRALEREMGAKDTAAVEGPQLDKKNRLAQFRKRYCNIHDNNDGLDDLCKGTAATPETVNKDIDFMRTVDRSMTLGIDFTDNVTTDDEQDIMALASNLYSNDVFIRQPESSFIFGTKENSPYRPMVLDVRSIVAKRSVAENSFAHIVGMRTQGSPAAATGTSNSEDTAQYMTLIMKELGVPDTEIPRLLGGVKNGDPVRPSYYAQMDILTKKIIQNPTFFVNLYDSTTNVERKSATLQAIKNMQDFDRLDSALRTEAMLSVLLETKLDKAQKSVENKIQLMTLGGETN